MSVKYYSQNKHQFQFVFTPDPNLFELETLCADKTQYYYTLANELPWDKIEWVYNKCLNNQKKGTSNKPARAVVGALLVKHLEVLSDERTIEFIKQNPYAQYLCGLTYYAKSPLFSPELFVTIRKRLNINTINAISKFIHELIRDKQYQQAIEKAELARAKAETDGTLDKVEIAEPKVENTLKVDATCHDVEMRYPVDINLLEDVSRHIYSCLDWVCPGNTKPENKRKETRSAYLKYIKVKSQDNKEKRKDLIWLQINNIKHDYRILIDALGKINFNDIRYMPKYLINPLKAGLKVVEQQEFMITKGIHTCPDRICSIFQPHVRCILRGKAGRRYEYGPKVDISDCNGTVYVDRISWNNYNEGADLPDQLENYKERMGDYPEEVLADKIYMTKKNLEHIASLELVGGGKIKCDCPRLGRTEPQGPTKEEQYKATCKRNPVEGDFGNSKRRYDSNEIRAKLPETAESWICLCYLAQNAMKLAKCLA